MRRPGKKDKRSPVASGPYPDPYVVRFGPWARNLYLGVPVALTFGIIGIVADMPWWLQIVWFTVVGIVMVMCLFAREVRIHARDRVVVMWRLVALVPVWTQTYPMTSFRSIKGYYSEYSMTGEPTIDAHTVYLELQDGKSLPVQSYSSGAADVKPPVDELFRALPALTELPVLQKS